MERVSPGVRRELEESLDAAISLQSADMGNVQLLGDDGALRIVAHRRFHPVLLEYFKVVHPGNGAPCERAVAAEQPVVVTDVHGDAAFAPHRAIAQAAGIRAVQSIPLVHTSKRVIGVLSLLYESSLPSAEWCMDFLRASAIRTAAILERGTR